MGGEGEKKKAREGASQTKRRLEGTRGPSHGGTELGNTGRRGERGAEGPTASLNSLSTSTGRWPIMAARCRAQHPELGGPAEPSGERSRGENATSSALTQKPAAL